MSGTTTPLTVFSNPGRTVPRTQPVVADANGRFPAVYLPDRLYAEQLLGTGGAEPWYDDGLGVAVPVVDPVDPTPTPDAGAYFQTGDTKWRMDSAILPGWVRMNGNRIGSGPTGASERGHADTQNLFIFLYNAFADDIAPVSGGRGTSGALADYNLAKTIAVPTMRGLLAAGLDDMGSSASGRLQTFKDLTVTAGSNSATVNDNSRLAPGMFVFANGISGGTFITQIVGNALILSAVATGSGVVAARFAVTDVQRPGAVGGDFLSGISNANLPVAMPGGTTVYDDPPDYEQRPNNFASLAFGDGGTATTVTGIWQGEKSVEESTTDLPPVTLNVTNTNPTAASPSATCRRCVSARST